MTLKTILRYTFRYGFFLLTGMLVGHFAGHVFHHHPFLWAAAMGLIIAFGISPAAQVLEKKMFGEAT